MENIAGRVKNRKILFLKAASFFQNLAHVPLTQSKRKDPLHVPYYLVNFETVVRGVIDETDDVLLFDDGDLDVVKAFRSLDLVCGHSSIVAALRLS